jgi:hypothetical protein
VSLHDGNGELVLLVLQPQGKVPAVSGTKKGASLAGHMATGNNKFVQ